MGARVLINEIWYKSAKVAGPWPLNVIVRDGAVELWGLVESAAEKTAIRVTAEETEGARAVTDNIIVRPVTFGDH
ncbi:MAG: BON domain-containing protein [Pseudomonadota bacterium]